MIFGEDFMENYEDPYKIGFNLVKNTYSGSLTNYIMWDIMVLIMLLLHNYYLFRIGLS